MFITNYKSQVLSVFLGGLGLLSCNFNPDVTVTDESSVNQEKEAERFITFSTRADFLATLDAIRSGHSVSSLRSSTGVHIPKGFKSIRELAQEKEKIATTRAMPGNGFILNPIIDIPLDPPVNVIDLTEINKLVEATVQEYSVSKAQNLVPDYALQDLIGSALQVSIGDTIYQITEVGTFYALKKEMETLQRTIQEFRSLSKKSTTDDTLLAIDKGDVPIEEVEQEYKDLNIDEQPVGASHTLSNGVTYISTYGRPDPTFSDGWKQPQVEQPIEPLYPEFHKPYNVETYKWEKRTWLGKAWSRLVGKNIKRYNNFDNSHRVSLRVYDLNFGFIQTAGVSTTFQQRKRILFVPYWSNVQADRLAIGFNYLYGTYKQHNPKVNGIYGNPLAPNHWGTFSATVNNQVAHFTHMYFPKIDIMKEWTEEISVIVPNIEIFGYSVVNPKDIAKALYEMPEKKLAGYLNANVNKYILDPYKKSNYPNPTDPRIAYMSTGQSVDNFDTKSLLMGVKEYNNRSSKSIQLSFSIGFNLSISGFGVPSFRPFLPEDYDMNDFDMFAAAYYNGQWRGVRMVTK